uniref:Uncharacterized protein n=1 Tax=Cajanus cajan TaxID=3821 RepID=A0A151RSX6_CAJCA|nr:hypothetical protein KK1_032775 [Cajanus cajan]
MVHKLFYLVPVWRWPARDPFFYCANCHRSLPSYYSPPPAAPRRRSSHSQLLTRVCGKVLEVRVC